MRSKAVNTGTWPEPTLWARIKAPFVDAYYSYIRRPVRRLRHMLAFALFARNDYDFDSCYLINLIVFKLKRMQRALTVDAHCIHDDNTLKALRLAVRIGERLSADNYNYAHDAHDRKWGELHMELDPLPGEQDDKHRGSVARFWRDKTTPETKEQERTEFLAAYDADEKARERDARWFFKIIAKYYRNWWD